MPYPQWQLKRLTLLRETNTLSFLITACMRFAEGGLQAIAE